MNCYEVVSKKVCYFYHWAIFSHFTKITMITNLKTEHSKQDGQIKFHRYLIFPHASSHTFCSKWKRKLFVCLITNVKFNNNFTTDYVFNQNVKYFLILVLSLNSVKTMTIHIHIRKWENVGSMIMIQR